ncbi:hypothetical protein HZH68_006885 [Vespula germanica]|uniref:Uncharacterized protein n=1 Tax=Vespula germanica TaxID=30212 RepID=A0A834K715_VESGE|nr:hypothetical protein HZH68_006885 [Vespula germanica]
MDFIEGDQLIKFVRTVQTNSYESLVPRYRPVSRTKSAIAGRMKRCREEEEEEVEEEEEEGVENFHDPCIYHAGSLSFIWDKALVTREASSWAGKPAEVVLA